jgi:hypothetical protein
VGLRNVLRHACDTSADGRNEAPTFDCFKSALLLTGDIGIGEHERRPAEDDTPTTGADDAMGAVLQSGRTVEALSDLIGAIYDCALDPGKWEALLERLNHEFRFSSSIVGIVPLASPEQIVNVSVGFDEEWLSHTATYTADSIELWGGANT